MSKLAEAEEKRKESNLPLGFAWFVKCLRLYATFEGRARRREFLIFTFWSAVIASLLPLLVNPTLSLIVNVLFFLPNLAVDVRRLHDIGKNGWWVLLPAAGGVAIAFAAVAVAESEVVAIFLTFTGLCCIGYFWWLALSDGQPGTNQYGENPKKGC
ncbi:MAG: DUF805 domain-containing protein [Candidatus Dadabacteria bacterium]|nr:DUF805 domain-containing protein [Candidatus Dadabacteria bacterium]